MFELEAVVAASLNERVVGSVEVDEDEDEDEDEDNEEEDVVDNDDTSAVSTGAVDEDVVVEVVEILCAEETTVLVGVLKGVTDVDVEVVVVLEGTVWL